MNRNPHYVTVMTIIIIAYMTVSYALNPVPISPANDAITLLALSSLAVSAVISMIYAEYFWDEPEHGDDEMTISRDNAIKLTDFEAQYTAYKNLESELENEGIEPQYGNGKLVGYWDHDKGEEIEPLGDYDD